MLELAAVVIVYALVAAAGVTAVMIAQIRLGDPSDFDPSSRFVRFARSIMARSSDSGRSPGADSSVSQVVDQELTTSAEALQPKELDFDPHSWRVVLPTHELDEPLREYWDLHTGPVQLDLPFANRVGNITEVFVGGHKLVVQASGWGKWAEGVHYYEPGKPWIRGLESHVWKKRDVGSVDRIFAYSEGFPDAGDGLSEIDEPAASGSAYDQTMQYLRDVEVEAKPI